MSALSIPELDDDVDMLTAALAYAECGWYIVPALRGTKNPGSTFPKGTNWCAKSSRDPKQITAWFAGTDHDIALHCGRSGAVVFDVDDPDKLPPVLAKYLPTAPFQSTRPDQPGRGHYVFLQPPGRTIGNGGGRLGKAWGEVRGLNGVIIAEPSYHADGGHYRWVRR
jgi:Bifunctional DNA primase/polymerase, N-terminal